MRDSTRKLVLELRDIPLHLQSDQLSTLWKQLLADAIVFLKSRDGREKFHDKMTLGLDKLYEFQKEYRRFEPILYGAVPNYRDHVAHTFRVMLLGEYIVRKSFGFDKIGLRPVERPTKNVLEVSSDEKEAVWSIIALTHDLGIPLEEIYHISQRVRDMLRQFGMVSAEELASGYFLQFGNLSDFVIRFVSSDLVPQENKFAVHIQPKYYQKLLSALSRFDHGLVSTMILMKDLVYFKESDFTMDYFKLLEREDARQFLIRNVILRAIASHSCEDIYHLTITNFPFILTLCDEMQEWGRPRLVDVTKRAGSETELTINKFGGQSVSYKITFSFPRELRPSDEERKSVEREIRDYFKAKRDKWLNVLRSAVSPERMLRVRFEVEDKTSDRVKTYFMDHEDPEHVTIEPIDMRNPLPSWKSGKMVSELA